MQRRLFAFITSTIRHLKISTSEKPHTFHCYSLYGFEASPTLSGSSSALPSFLEKRSVSTSSAANFLWGENMGDIQSSGLPDTKGIERKNKIKLTDEEWKAKLTPEQYSVCRHHGTERAWTGELLNNKGKGIYQCACCGADLFNSSTKFDSGSGWPSFYDTLKEKDGDLPAVDTYSDRSHGMVRTEVLCGRCDSHLGHVFNDGPQPTGLRYCINSVSLKFKKDSAESSGESGKTKNDL